MKNEHLNLGDHQQQQHHQLTNRFDWVVSFAGLSKCSLEAFRATLSFNIQEQSQQRPSYSVFNSEELFNTS